MTEAKPTSGSNYTFLIVALVLGAAATAIAFMFLSAQAKKQENEGPKITLLFAKRNLQADSILDPVRDLKEVSVPATEQMRKFADSCYTSEFRPLAKQRLSRNIPVDNPLMRTDLGMKVDFDIDTGPNPAPPKGPMRAMSIPARGPNAVSGLLAPNDYVVLMMTKPGTPTTAPAGDRPAPSNVTYSLLKGQKVRVLAVEARLSLKPRSGWTAIEQFDSMKESENMQTVTLEVSEDQAKEILQENGGNLLPITLLWAGVKPVEPPSKD